MSNGSIRTKGQRGFNLVEVIIAMAMLGTVLLSVVTLFVAGRTNVYGGKTMTQGVAVATHVMEDLSSLSAAGALAAFGIANNTAVGNVDIDTTLTQPTDLYTNSVLRTTKNITAGTDPNGYLQRWNDEIINDNKMANAYVALVFTPSNADAGLTGAAPFGNASVLRVRAIVRWQEGFRWREVLVDTVKTRRPAG
ncbi:MAG: prepilin-type N-terminal cleavage/methylation domain-containing protein [Thermoanaerobaculia bacterium]